MRSCVDVARVVAEDDHMTITTITRHSGSELRAARERAGLTRAELAQLADCSLAHIANCEHGAVPRHSPTLDRVWALLDEKNAAQA